MNAEMLGDALEAFLRAERYEGSRPDISLNMRIARAKIAKTKRAPEPWHRPLLFWHYGLAASTRAAVAAISFSLLWLGLTLRVFGMRRLARYVLAISIAALALFGSSIATTIVQETSAREPVFLEAAPKADK